MKKKILSLAIMAVAVFTASSAFAQAPADKPCCGGKDKKECRGGDKAKCDRPDTKCANPFEGLNLTEAQQAQIKAIPCPAQSIKAACKDLKSDTTKMDRSQCAAVVKDIRKDYLSQIQAILSPEQYVQFLENQFVNAPGKAGKKDGPRMDKKDKKGGKDVKGDKKDRKDKKDKKGGDKGRKDKKDSKDSKK